MSNVLIGIIGVILFIGLALAGALFLGPRFQESTSTSKAAANVQAAQQITNAIDLYKLNEGTQYDASSYPSNLNGTYLKSVPTFQGLQSGQSPVLISVVVGSGPTQESPLLLRSRLDASTGKSVCEAVQKQMYGSSTVPSEAVSRIGCYTNGTTYFFYTRIETI